MTPQQWGQFVDTPHTPYFKVGQIGCFFLPPFFKKAKASPAFRTYTYFRKRRGKEEKFVGGGYLHKDFRFRSPVSISFPFPLFPFRKSKGKREKVFVVDIA